ncbi:MAG TPA: hypothetical protein VNG51_20880 [Ktedonobacteraceae bacterium]|nr:hypothetical protein [Ktedonobacteraceae bacterium]
MLINNIPRRLHIAALVQLGAIMNSNKLIHQCRGRFIAPTADLSADVRKADKSADVRKADKSAVGAINRPLQI